MSEEADATPRSYETSRSERAVRSVRLNFNRALFGAISAAAVTAGFLSAAGITLPLLAYIAGTVVGAILFLVGLGMSGPRQKYAVLALAQRSVRKVEGRPPQLELVPLTPNAPTRQILAARNDDPVHGAGLRALLAPGAAPVIVIPSNPHDISNAEQLVFPLFANRRGRSYARLDLAKMGIPISSYSFTRELPREARDVDHTFSVKDVTFVPELCGALARSRPETAPRMWPEHCVDPLQLSEQDVIVVGGPDSNFWYAALFEPVIREATHPPSSVPVAIMMRRERDGMAVYSSQSMSMRLAYADQVFGVPAEAGGVELPQRFFPAHGMILVCRNPFAAALGKSRWCVFVAGSDSLGTAGATLALSLMLDEMHGDPTKNFWSLATTESDDVCAPVAAVVCRVVEVEQGPMRRDGAVIPRQRRKVPKAGVDPRQTDSDMPTEVEILSYQAIGEPVWANLRNDHHRPLKTVASDMENV